MKIQNTASELYRSGYASGIRGGAVEGSTAGKQATQSQSSSVSSERNDRVQISEAGRALAAQASGAPSEEVRAELSPERVAQIRQRVLEGAYNSVNVVEEVARRMLERGDI